MSEFSIIKQYFENLSGERDDITLGIGDDAALVKTDKLLAISVDTFIENVHFPDSTCAYDIGWKSLAVNLSDMAAMGAEPCWMTLAITMPKADHEWLAEYCRGLSALARQFKLALIGGDTSRGPLSITIQITGIADEENTLCRHKAKAGDAIYVTGYIGDAALGLISLQADLNLSSTERYRLQQKLNRPQPRVKEGFVLRRFVNAAIDISDGLYADLGHILSASEKGAVVWVKDIPVSAEYRWNKQGDNAYDLALTGGDDYELCLTVAADKEAEFLHVARENNIDVTKIGEITENREYQLLVTDDKEYVLDARSFNHFS